MKISNSKQELARIISENGGWRDGAAWAAQDACGTLNSYQRKPVYSSGCTGFGHGGGCFHKICAAAKIKNWHQTILSRAEYFHLYPAPDAKPQFCESVMRSIPEPTAKPTIEQLSADYRNAKDYADRKRDEADKAKVESDAALSELEKAIAEIGFAITPIGAAAQEPELVITDWRDLLVGDEVEYCDGAHKYMIGEVGTVAEIDNRDGGRPIRIASDKIREFHSAWPVKWRFIRRP